MNVVCHRLPINISCTNLHWAHQDTATATETKPCTHSHGPFSEVKKTCAIEHNITKEMLHDAHVAAHASADAAEKAEQTPGAAAATPFVPSQDIKCFAKCVIVKSNIVKQAVIDVDRLVEYGVAHGKNGDKIRANASKCVPNIDGEIDCEAAYELYNCLRQHKH